MSMNEMAYLYHQAGLGQAQAEIERRIAAQGIRKNLAMELQDSLFVADTNLEQYAVKARGLRHFLNYILDIDSSHEVLDIGAGTLRGISELAQTIYGTVLDFSATSLSRPTRLAQFLGKFYRTSGEYLRGIKKESIAGVLAIQSIGFSRSPVLVATRLHHTVVKGGIIKATFRKKSPYSNLWERKYNEWGYTTHESFTNTLKQLGWDVAVSEGKIGDDSEDDVIVAIKPGGSSLIKAEEVLQTDLEDDRNQRQIV